MGRSNTSARSDGSAEALAKAFRDVIAEALVPTNERLDGIDESVKNLDRRMGKVETHLGVASD